MTHTVLSYDFITVGVVMTPYRQIQTAIMDRTAEGELRKIYVTVF
jgi:hypothetical protein